MKKHHSSFLPPVSLTTATLLCAIAVHSFAQTNPPPPVVSLRASDASASEAGDPGRFTLFREGPTNLALSVFCVLGGSASNGVDYARITNWISVPAGAREVPIPVAPVDDALAEGQEYVNLHLVPPPTLPPVYYLIGFSSFATVAIQDNDGSPTNRPPGVRLTSPANGATFPAPANVLVCAAAEDYDGYVATVEFFVGDRSLGTRTNLCPLCAGGPANPFCLTWTNVPLGNYVLRALATDNLGATSASAPVQISVVQPPPRLPVVTIVASDAHATEPCLVSNLPPVLDPGRFTVWRDGGTNVPFIVQYRIGGSASNGVDYALLSGTVEIPAGRHQAQIVVEPLADVLAEFGEAVALRLVPVACPAIFPPPEDCYEIGLPYEAAVLIRDCEPRITNAPPRVWVTTPTNGAVFFAPVNIPIITDTVDVDGYVGRVQFFANDRLIGVDAKEFLIPPTNGTHIGYEMVWSNPPPGIYALRGKAYDALGASAFSEPIRISVLGTNPPPQTNFPPLVTIAAVDPLAAEGTNCWRWYTNLPGWDEACRTNYAGTNTATFVVRRSGATNASLTVHYAIRGSASNGVDYAELSGAVTIPVGARSARITVIPRDDALAECSESVVLGLLAASNSPPSYLIGWPGRAAAIIVDNDQPLPGTLRLCDGLFHWTMPAPNGFNYRIETSLDMIHWVAVSTNTVTEFGIRFAEPETEDFPARFYRVVPEAAPPAD